MKDDEKLELTKRIAKGWPKPGEVRNPYGRSGNTRKAQYRASYFNLEYKKAPVEIEKKLKRKRIELQVQKAKALEAHELQQMARESATSVMDTLIEIAANKRAPEATRIAAANSVLDRAYGKASQTSITASVTNGKATEIDSTELDKRIGNALKRVEELTNRKAKAGSGKKRPANLREYN